MKRCAIALASLLVLQQSVFGGILQMTPCRHPPCVDCYSNCFGYYPTQWRPWPCASIEAEGLPGATPAQTPAKTTDEAPAVMPQMSFLPGVRQPNKAGGEPALFGTPAAAPIAPMPEWHAVPIVASRYAPAPSPTAVPQGQAVVIGPFPVNCTDGGRAQKPHKASVADLPRAKPLAGEAVIFGPFPSNVPDKGPSSTPRTEWSPQAHATGLSSGQALIYGPFPAPALPSNASQSPVVACAAEVQLDWPYSPRRPVPGESRMPTLLADGHSEEGPLLPEWQPAP